MNKLEVLKQTRAIAAKSLIKVLKEVLNTNDSISEMDLRDRWVKEMRKDSSIFPNGWYMPPPIGIGVLFGDDKHKDRINFTTLRIEKYWPRKDVRLNRENGIIVFYASPVNRLTGIIGDFGLNVYFGKDKKIQKHMRTIYSVIHQIFNHVKVGCKLSELFEYEYKIFKKNGLTNDGWVSINDVTGINCGHTIPATDNDWDNEEFRRIKSGKNWGMIANIVSKKRKFVNSLEETKIKPGMAVTIEARLKSIDDSDIPTIYFHTIVFFDKNGRKELLTGFDEIFKLTGMDYMLR